MKVDIRDNTPPGDRRPPNPLADRLLAIAQQQFQAGIQADEAGYVHRSAFVAFGGVLVVQFDAGEIAGVGHTVPANPNRAKQIEVLAAEIEDSGPFRP